MLFSIELRLREAQCYVMSNGLMVRQFCVFVYWWSGMLRLRRRLSDISLAWLCSEPLNALWTGRIYNKVLNRNNGFQVTSFNALFPRAALCCQCATVLSNTASYPTPSLLRFCPVLVLVDRISSRNMYPFRAALTCCHDRRSPLQTCISSIHSISFMYYLVWNELNVANPELFYRSYLLLYVSIHSHEKWVT